MNDLLISNEELNTLRKETKGTLGKIHFNNAGSSLPPDVVLNTIINYLQEEAILGGYEFEFKYKEQLENIYLQIAKLINADKDEIAIVENASTAWWIAFNGIEFKKDDEIITSEMEYVTNIIGFLNLKNTKGVNIKVIQNDSKGNFSINELKESITPKTKLIAITHIASAAGAVLPVIEIGKIANHHNILFLVDACQSVGQMPIDVKEINCDMLSVTGRKYLRAPRGTGFLYVRKKIQDQLKPLYMDGFTVQSINEQNFTIRNDARRFELYESSRALHLGLGKAVEYAINIGMDRIWNRIKQLAILLRQKLENIDGIKIHDISDEKCGIITFTVKDIDCNLIKNKLAEKQINVSIGLAKSTLYYMNNNHLSDVIRASIHYYNSEEEIVIFCNALIDMIKIKN